MLESFFDKFLNQEWYESIQINFSLLIDSKFIFKPNSGIKY